MAARERKRWSQHVTDTSNALTLEEGVFSRDDPRSIARSLKRSAERSKRRKSDPYRSALSMLTFYVNRAGRNMPATRRHKLEAAKGELKKLFDRKVAAAGRGAKKHAASKQRAPRTK